MSNLTDVTIIGAGPVGLFAIFQCGMLGLKCHVFDTLDRVGGQCAALYPEKPIYDIPAHPEILAADLIENLYKQALPFNPIYCLNEQIVKITPLNNEGTLWEVEGSQGSKAQTRSILIAAGVGAFGPNKPPLENLEQFEKKCIHYYVGARETYRNKHIVIAGGGDSAVDWAISLQEVAASVSVVHRRAKFRCAPESEKKLNLLSDQGKINLVTPYQLSALKGEEDQLEYVIVESLDGEKKSLEADYLLPFFGLSMNLGPIADWELSLNKNQIVINPLTGATNRPGIYAIGDIATYEQKLKLILTGFAEAAQTAHAIHHFLNPEAIMHFEHSTTKGLPEKK